MSWSYQKSGRASKLAEVVREQLEQTGGCPKGTAEETAKNALGVIAETLCKGFAKDVAVSIKAHGSAWNQPDGRALSQSCSFTFETLGDFVE